MKLSVAVPFAPSATLASATETIGSGSSSITVAEPWESATRAPAGRTEFDQQRLIGFISRVADDQHGDRSSRLAGGDDQGAAGGDIVGSCRSRSIGRVEFDPDFMCDGGREGHGESRFDQAAAPFADDRVADAQGHIVVDDCARPFGIQQNRPRGIRQAQEQRLIGLGEGVADQDDAHRLAGLARIERERAAGGLIIAAALAVPASDA